MKINPSMVWGAVGLFFGYMLAKRAGAAGAGSGSSTDHNTISGPADFWTFAGSWGSK